MRRRILTIVASSATCTILLCCSDDTTRYATPGSLDGLRPHPPPGGYVVPQSKARGCPPSGSASDAGVDGGAPDCGVSFERDVLGKVLRRLECGRSGCHAPGGIEPIIDLGDASAARARLVTFVLPAERDAAAMRFYVEPCATDPARSSIGCNLDGGCGKRMPPSYISQATDEEHALVARWLACGAPPN